MLSHTEGSEFESRWLIFYFKHVIYLFVFIHSILYNSILDQMFVTTGQLSHMPKSVKNARHVPYFDRFGMCYDRRVVTNIWSNIVLLQQTSTYHSPLHSCRNGQNETGIRWNANKFHRNSYIPAGIQPESTGIGMNYLI